MAEHRSERGAVTAETAVVIPLLVALTAGLAWMVSLGVTQVRVIDAAREAARAAARGEQAATARALGARVAPDGAEVTVSTRPSGQGGIVEAHVRAPVTSPDGLFGFLPTFTVDATAAALAEER